MIPDWLAQDNVAVPFSSKRRNGGKGFVERTIEGTARFLRDAILSEAIAKRQGLLQILDPRVRLVTILVLIVCISLMKSPVTIWVVYLFVLLLAVASSVPLLFFIKRVWLFIPLFSAVIVIPALFNIVTPGEPFWTMFHLPRNYDFGPYHIPETIAITRQGLLTAATFICRVAASVSLAVLLTLTTRWSDLLRALGVLRVPQIFILILAMTYRYILLLVQAVQNIHIARKSRTLHYGSTRSEQRWVASRMGYLFKRTWLMSQDVHRAMLS
ncbi:MAG: cobalt ECF transporter T component CbiQ, partial [Desulfuromonadales bacterium]|nr:cobalt ECF transporter T component CbiQ [Desulfuromonadales bacterium]